MERMPLENRYVNPYTDFGFKKLFEAAEIAKFTKAEYDEYEKSLKIYRDWKNTIDTAVMKAEKRGEERGEKRGEEKATYNIASKLKASGVSLDMIVDATGLLPDEIRGL